MRGHRNDTPLTAEQQALAAKWFGLIGWARRRWPNWAHRLGVDFDGHAGLALVMAARSFDPEKRWSFRAHAERWLLGCLQRAIRQDRLIRLPSNHDLAGLPGVTSAAGDAIAAAPDGCLDSESLEYRDESRALLAKLSQYLASHQVQAIRLVVLESRGLRQAAEILKTTPDCVKMRVARALKELRLIPGLFVRGAGV